MNKNVYISNFQNYISSFDMTDPRNQLKQIHTLKVAELCEQIAQKLSLTKEDIDFAWLSGLLHDIGRFEQLKRYDTFMDSKSIDHADLGADILFHQGLIDMFPVSAPELMEKVVRIHNKFEVPLSWTKREKLFADILRDADKIDIIRVNLESSREVIYGFPEKEFKNSIISPEVMEDLRNHQTVLRSHKKSAVDYLMGHVSFLYGLVFPISIEILHNQGYYTKLLSFESENPVTCKQLEIIAGEAKKYIQKMRVQNTGDLTI